MHNATHAAKDGWPRCKNNQQTNAYRIQLEEHTRTQPRHIAAAATTYANIASAKQRLPTYARLGA